MNFMDTCNMNCHYCYIPFIKEKPDFEITKKIIKRLVELGVKVITYGGGDPYIYSEFRSLIDYTYDAEIEIHIDTNGINLKPADYIQLNKKVSLLALPIDGAKVETHDHIRNFRREHLRTVMKHLESIQNYKVRTKINTVVCRMNSHEILAIQELLDNYRIHIWSLYQFWPLHGAAFFKPEFEISNKEYEDLISKVREDSINYEIEKNTIRKRAHTYLFISPNGKVYTHNPNNSNAYIFIGNFFESIWIEEWNKMNETSLREDARQRYFKINQRNK